MAISGLPAYAKQTTEPVKITSFSGAYLAARIAEGDNDLDNAIAYYKQALAFDPNDTSLQQSLMLSLIAQGRFNESLVYADKLKEVPDVDGSRAWPGRRFFHKKDFTKAGTGSSFRSSPISTGSSPAS
jgi:tetratricopeptide (TPR) repeat protein